MSTRSPLKWYGGKSLLAKSLIALFPPHRVYIEPFGGGASVLLAKEQAPVEVYNDQDPQLSNFFRVIKNPLEAAALRSLLELTLYARQEHQQAREQLENETDPIKRAAALYTLVRQSRNGQVAGSWRYCLHSDGVSPFYRALESFTSAGERLRDVTITNLDFQTVLEAWDSADTLVYLDPPYLPATRVAQDVYRHELDTAGHQRLLDTICRLEGKVILSGYGHPLYEQALAGWTRLEVRTACHSSPGTNWKERQTAKPQRLEVVWINPAAICPSNQDAIRRWQDLASADAIKTIGGAA